MSKQSIGILLMHGGGSSSGSRFAEVAKFLEGYDIVCHAFDFHGSSLAAREAEAETELEQFIATSHLSLNQIYLWGSSMSGFTACALAQKYPALAGLILQGAAAYGLDLQDVSFGDKFTQKIRQPLSWYTSPSFVQLSQYPGRKLVIYGSHDDVIPLDVQSKYAQSADQVLIIPSVGHKLLLPTGPAARLGWDKMVQSALDFIQGRND